MGAAQAARERGRVRSGRGRVRRHPLGGARLPRPDRARRRPFTRRADPVALPRTAGAARAQARLGRRQAERHDRAARAALGDADRRAARAAARRGDARAEALRERIRDAAEGNPLFVEEMVAFVEASGDAEVTVPGTIQALLAARLDQLEPAERGVLERGSVEGRVFHRGAVQALAPEETQVESRLTGLVRKELVRPDKAQLTGEDAYRFRHLLIRDAAYEALPKATRAELHELFADWLAEHGAGARRARRDPRVPPRAGAPLQDRARRQGAWRARPARCGAPCLGRSPLTDGG